MLACQPCTDVFCSRYAKESKVLFQVAGYADSAQQQSHAGSVELHDLLTGQSEHIVT